MSVVIQSVYLCVFNRLKGLRVCLVGVRVTGLFETPPSWHEQYCIHKALDSVVPVVPDCCNDLFHCCFNFFPLDTSDGFSWLCSHSGDITLTIQLDTLGQITEAHEGNNMAHIHGLSIDTLHCTGTSETARLLFIHNGLLLLEEQIPVGCLCNDTYPCLYFSGSVVLPHEPTILFDILLHFEQKGVY